MSEWKNLDEKIKRLSWTCKCILNHKWEGREISHMGHKNAINITAPGFDYHLWDPWEGSHDTLFGILNCSPQYRLFVQFSAHLGSYYQSPSSVLVLQQNLIFYWGPYWGQSVEELHSQTHQPKNTNHIQ